MIKRLAIFLVLLGGGFFALYSLIEDSQGGTAAPLDPGDPGDGGSSGKSGNRGSTHNTGDASTAQEHNPRGPGIHLDTGKKDSAVTVKTGGRQSFVSTTPIALPSGAIQLVPVYEVNAEDSLTEPDNKYTLLRVTVDFFKVDTSDPGRPRTIPDGQLRASRARLELSQSGQIVRLEEDKLIELWDVIYTSDSVGSLHGIKVTLGQARILNTEDRVRLWTPDPREPVKIVATGRRGFEIDGRGLDASMPTRRDESGDVQITETGIRTLQVLAQPVLTEGDTVLRSTGPLLIEDDGTTGATLVTMRDDVYMFARLDSAATGTDRKGPRQEVVARGDTLRATMVRTAIGGKETSSWTRIDLHGMPARLDDHGQLDLTCAHLTVLPDVEGEPYWFTARGTGSLAPKLKFRQKDETHEFESTGRVHVVRLHRQHGLLLESFGIPMAGIPAEFEQVILFEGRSTVTSRRDHLRIVADRGLTVIRSERPELRDSFIVRGHGAVRVTGDGVRIDGNQGFTLTQSAETQSAGTQPAATGDSTQGPASPGRVDVVRHIRVGPRHHDSNHRYDIEHWPLDAAPARGEGGEGGGSEATTRRRPAQRLQIVGSGTCSIHMRGRSLERLDLSSIAEDIGVTVAAAGPTKTARIGPSRAWQLGSALAHFGADGTLERFVGKGAACRMSLVSRKGTVEGSAREIHQSEPDAYRLIGDLAELRHTERGFLRGRTVVVRKLTDEDFQLRATQDAHLHGEDIRPKGPARDDKPTDRSVFDLRAREIRVEPFMMPPAVAGLFEDLLPAVPRLDLDTRHMFAEDGVVLEFFVEQGGSVSRGVCRGQWLALRSDRAGKSFVDGKIIGAPARFDSLDASGRHTMARARLIRFFGQQGGQYMTLYPVDGARPELTLFGDLRGATGIVPSTGASTDLADLADLASRVDIRPAEPTTVLTCDGPIEVKPRQILFSGPVQVRSFDAQGNPDPTGLSLDSRSMVIDRTPAGTIAGIQADGDIEFGWAGVRGTCDVLAIDVVQTTLQVRGTTRPAVVQLPGEALTVRLLNYNYRTRMATAWKARFKRRPPATTATAAAAAPEVSEATSATTAK